MTLSATRLSIPAYVTEHAAITRYIQTIGESVLPVDPTVIVNLYVSLKSKPLAILVGATHSGKREMVKSFAETITGGDPIRCQMTNGHAWWAAKSGDVAVFTKAQSRFNASKLLAIMEEARQPENWSHVFVAGLNDISLAELSGFSPTSRSSFSMGRLRMCQIST